MDSFKIEAIQFNMFYDFVPNMRENAAEIEKEMKLFFPLGCNVVQDLGPNAPVEMPCIFGGNQDLKYNMAISKINGTFSWQKNDKDEQPVDIFKEFETGVTKFYNTVLDKVPGKKTTFCGITVQVEYPCKSSAVKRIEEVFLKVSLDQKIHDAAVKLTFLQDNEYYINVSISNKRDIKDLNKDIAIVVQIDINDRHRYNLANGMNSYSKNDVLKSLLNICNDVINKRLEKLLTNGEY